MKRLMFLVSLILVAGLGCIPSLAPPVIVALEANPSEITAGESATLLWNVTGATSVSIDQGIGAVGAAGTKVVSPSTTTVYTITATNTAGTVSKSVVVNVSVVSPPPPPPPPGTPPVIVAFSATPPEITVGGSATLMWNVTGATSISIDQGIGNVDAAGTSLVSPVTTTVYTLTATNDAGSTFKSLTVTVGVVSPPPAEKPDLIITAIQKLTGTGGYIVGYTIKNQGSAPSGATVTKLYANGVYKTSDSVPALVAGASVDRQFTGWTYDPNTPVIKVAADANAAVTESDEGNNEKQVSIAVEILVNFIDRAPTASWTSGAGSLTFPGGTGDSKGFACYRDNIKLENGKIYSRVLETHPQWVNDGWIGGSYPELTIPFGAKFVASVGFLDGASGTDGVTFQVFSIEPGPPAEPPLSVQLLDSKHVTYDSKLDSLDINLADIAGKKREIRLVVLAGPSSGRDWAVWVDAKMIR